MVENSRATCVATAITFLLLAVFPVLGQAQMAHGSGMAYNRATETTLEGTVDDVMNVPGTHAMSGTHLALNTKGETIHVHLGPSKFLEDQKISFAKGDRVKVTGSRVKGEGFEAILARTVTKENEVVKLRDEHGVPLWAAQGK